MLENKFWTTVFLAFITFLFAFIGFIKLSNDLSVFEIFEAFIDAVAIFSLSKPEETNVCINIARLFAYLTIFIGATFLFVKGVIQKWIVKTIMMQKHSIVCGLGENNRFYLDSELVLEEPGKIIIVEKDPTNPYIESYKAKGFGVIIGNILDKNFWNDMNICELENFIVSTGDDRRNIEVVTEFLDSCERYTSESFGISTRIYIHIESRDLNLLFQQSIVKAKEELKIDIIPYSFYEDSAKQLLATHSILGNKSKIIHTKEPYQIAVIGSGELAKYIVYQICKIAHLPNQNELTIYCVDKDADVFVKKLHKAFRYIDKVPSITIKSLNADSNSNDFYELSLWKEKNLTNVIICQDEEKDNLDIALSLYDKTYLQEANEEILKTKVLFAIFQEMTLSSTIDSNTDQLREFYTFANANEICSRENLIDEKIDSIAQLVNLGYGDEYNPEIIINFDDKKVDKNGKTMKEKMETKWFDNARMSDKESSRAQAIHLDVKLLALGLKKVPVTDKIDPNILLEKNRNIFEKHLGNQISNDDLKDASKELDNFWGKEKDGSYKSYEVKYFPTEYKTLFEKIVHSEHDRWNALHYLNGWVYEDFDGQDYDLKIKMKKIKHHNCLLTLEEFKTPDTQITLLYDVYSLLYIPNYLTNIEFEIVEKN